MMPCLTNYRISEADRLTLMQNVIKSPSTVICERVRQNSTQIRILLNIKVQSSKL